MDKCHRCGQEELNPRREFIETTNAFRNVHSFIRLFCCRCGMWLRDMPPVDKPQAA